MYGKLNCPVSRSHILISRRKWALGSTFPLFPTIDGWGVRCLWVEDLFSWKEGGMAHGLRRYAINTFISCINNILSPHSLGHFIHIAGLTETKYFWKSMEEPCVYSKSKNLSLYTYWLISSASQSHSVPQSKILSHKWSHFQQSKLIRMINYLFFSIYWNGY